MPLPKAPNHRAGWINLALTLLIGLGLLAIAGASFSGALIVDTQMVRSLRPGNLHGYASLGRREREFVNDPAGRVATIRIGREEDAGVIAGAERLAHLHGIRHDPPDLLIQKRALKLFVVDLDWSYSDSKTQSTLGKNQSLPQEFRDTKQVRDHNKR